MKKNMFLATLGTMLFSGTQLTIQSQSFDFELANYNFNKYVKFVHGAIAKGDVDNDGDVDVFISTRYPNVEGLLYLNDGNGSFTVSTSNVFPGSDVSYADFVDIDKDGDLDLMLMGRVQNANSSLTNLYLNDGSGTFSLKQNLGITNCYSGEFSVGDIDGDNDLDIVICGIEGSNNPIAITKIYVNNGSLEFTALTTSSIENLQGGSVKLVDIDNDTDLDIVILGHIEATLDSPIHFKTYLNNGSGIFTELSNPNLIPTMFSAMALADSDGDGDIDLLVSGKADGNVSDSTRLYTNNGNGLFVETTKFPLSVIGSIHFADFDEDGDQDIFFDGISSNNICCTSKNRTINIYENIGGNNFIVSFSQNNPPIYTKSVIADFNGDSKLDFIMLGDGITINESTQMYFSKNNVTGISNSPESNDVVLYPNPSTGVININTETNLQSVVIIYNSLGEIVYSNDYYITNNPITLNEAPGIYFIVVRLNNTISTTKFILQ